MAHSPALRTNITIVLVALCIVDSLQSIRHGTTMTDAPPAANAIAQINQRRAKTLSSIAEEAIEQMIVMGEIEAGDRINESTLATRLGISRGPVREACRSLERAGLLVSVVNQGTFVREMTLEEARDLYEVRSALGGLAGRLVAERASDEALTELRRLVDQMDDAAQAGDVQRYYTLNLSFHYALVAASANPALAKSYRGMVNQLHLFRRRGLILPGSLKLSNQEHRALVDAVVKRDPDAAEQAARQHVAGGWARMRASV